MPLADIVTEVGGIVRHVALPRVALAPRIFIGRDVLNLGVIGGARIERGVEVAPLHQNPVRCLGVNVAGVVVCSILEGAGKGINQSARTEAILVRILKVGVSIRASYAKMIEVPPGLTGKTNALLVRSERMLHPGLADLLKAVIVARSAAHSIEIMRNKRMVCRGQRKKIHGHVAGIAGGSAHTQADLGPAISKFF